MRRKHGELSVAQLLLLFLMSGTASAVVVWGWLLYQRKHDPAVSSPTAVAAVPLSPPKPVVSVPKTRMWLREGTPEPSSRERRAPSRGKRTRSARDLTRKERRRVSKAVRLYYKLKDRPRFKRSKVVREWKRDFLIYPDLRAINARYQRDRDAVRFVAATVRSPNFKKMLRKYIGTPDVQAFMRIMSGSKTVSAASPAFTKDAKVASLLETLTVSTLSGMPGGSQLLKRRRRRAGRGR